MTDHERALARERSRRYRARKRALTFGPVIVDPGLLVSKKLLRDAEPPQAQRRLLSSAEVLKEFVPDVRPFAVPIPAPAHIDHAGKGLTAVVLPDIHVPFHDRRALEVALRIVEDVKPDIVVQIGDLVDCWQISRFAKDPVRRDTLQDNINVARTLLHQITQLAPNAQRVLLEGNHERRLLKAAWGITDLAARSIIALDPVQAAISWPVLLDLTNIGWEFVPEEHQSKRQILPKIITKHGTTVNKWSGVTARTEWQKYGASGISGHTHRAGIFTHRDHNGASVWIESGCLCDLEPSYGTDFDWQQAVVVLGWSADRYVMEEHIVRIRSGRAIWRSREITTSPEAS